MLNLSVVTPERSVLEAECDEVTLPGSKGEIGVLPGHAPLLTSVGTGILAYRQGGTTRQIVVHGGFCEVAGDGVRVLADLAEKPEEIDPENAREELAQAEAKLKAGSGAEIDAAVVETKLATSRIEIAERR